MIDLKFQNSVLFTFEELDLDRLFRVLADKGSGLAPKWIKLEETGQSVDYWVDQDFEARRVFEKHPLGFFVGTEAGAVFNLTALHLRSPYMKMPAIWWEVDDLNLDLSKDLVEVADENHALFGHLCTYDEYRHRNRIDDTFGSNLIESWVGTDLRKYLPGVYWTTYISNEISNLHNLDLDALKSSSCHHRTKKSGQVFQFFENPSSWKDNRIRLDELCQSLDGVFSKSNLPKPNRNAKDIETFLEVYDEYD